QSLEGMLMLLKMAPDLYRRNVGIATMHSSHAGKTTPREFAPADLEQLLPAMHACVREIGPFVDNNNSVRAWLLQLAFATSVHGGESVARLALDMWDLGYPSYPIFSENVPASMVMPLLQ